MVTIQRDSQGIAIIKVKCRDKSVVLNVRVDDEDYDKLIEFDWARIDKLGTIGRTLPDKSKYSMHKFILGTDHKEYEHINGDKCDNRKANLKEVDRSQRGKKRKISKNEEPTTGVYKKGKTIYTRVKYHNYDGYLGSYSSPEETQWVYDQVNCRLYKERKPMVENTGNWSFNDSIMEQFEPLMRKHQK